MYRNKKAEIMEAVKEGSIAATNDELEPICIDGEPTSTHNAQPTNTPNQPKLQRGIVADVASGIMDTILTVVSVVLGLLVLASGGILLYQGTVAPVGFNYVLWVFGGVCIVASVYIIFRTFSLASVMKQLKNINSDLQQTQSRLNGEVSELDDANKKMSANISEFSQLNADLGRQNAELGHQNAKLCKQVTELKLEISLLSALRIQLDGTVDELQSANSRLAAQVDELTVGCEELRKISLDQKKIADEFRAELVELSSSNNKLRAAISAIVQANDSSIEVGGMIKSILDDIAKERDAIRSEREAAEMFTTRLSAAVFEQMDVDNDGVISEIEQSTWLSRIRV